MIKKEKKNGTKYIVTTKDGNRTLGKHKTKKKAQKQLAAIEISKKKRKNKKQGMNGIDGV